MNLSTSVRDRGQGAAWCGPEKEAPMTSNPEALRSPGTTGARRDHRLRDGVDALGFPLIPLTLRKSRRIVTMRKADNSSREERAGPPRLALVRAAQPEAPPA